MTKEGENFLGEVTRRVESQIPKIRMQERNKLLKEIINSNLTSLPLYVVQENEISPTLASYIGAFNGKEVFWRGDCLLEAQQIIPNQAPKVRSLRLLSLTDEECEGLLISLKEKISQPKEKEVIVPPGYFVVRFQAQWAAGGHETPPEQKTFIQKADSPEEALNHLKTNLVFLNEYFFWDFNIIGPSDEKWRFIFVKETSEKRKEEIFIPSHFMPIAKDKLGEISLELRPI